MDFVVATAMGGDVDVCSGSSIQLTASGGTNYTWTPALYLDNTTIFNPLCTPPSSATFVDYIVQVGVGPVGVCSDTASLRVNILPPPVANAGPNDSICINSNITLSGTGGGVYTWTGLDIDAGASTASPVVSPTVTGDYIMNISVATGCTDADTVRIVVMPLPTVSAGLDKIICPTFSTPINGTTGLANYSWSPSGTLSCSNCSTPIAAPLATTTYTLTGYSAFGCAQTDNVLVSVSNPIANAGANISGCSSTQQPLGGPAQPGYTYSWSPPSMVTPSNSSNPNVTLFNNTQLDVTTTYTLTSTDVNGCIKTDQVDVTVYHNPICDAGTYTTINIGESYMLSGTSDDPAATYSWAPYNSTFMTNQNTANPTVTPPATTLYTMAVTNSLGCINLDTITLKVYVPPFIAVPNGFSPTSDITNNRLSVYYYGIKVIHEYKIFNRWGEKIYEKNNMFVDGTNGELVDAAWDGTFNGKLQPMDTYVYYITATTVNDEAKQYTGNITLVK
jgi:gliding motility-associated-like protein